MQTGSNCGLRSFCASLYSCHESGVCCPICACLGRAEEPGPRETRELKAGIHPEYVNAKIVCACGAEYPTRSIKEELRVEICAACHPFFTGKQKIVDTEGRVEKFMQRYGDKLKAQQEAKA